MRKIIMKRKGKQAKPVQKKGKQNEAENKESNDTSDNEEVSLDEEASEAEPETKKKKTDKRQQQKSKNAKKTKQKQPADEEESAEEDSAQHESNDTSDNEEASIDEEANEAESETKKKKTDKRQQKKSRNAKKTKQKQQPDDEESSEESEAQYEVEEILDEKVIRGVHHYLIRWKGYTSESDTWEPESTVDCADLLKEFKDSRQNGNKTSNSPAKKRKQNEKKNKMKSAHKKSSKSHEEEVDWDSGDEFEVDRIIDVYFKKNGEREFLVSWKGYASSKNSWEPEENLDCKDLISKFMNKVEAAKNVEQKELRLNRTPTERFTLTMSNGGRRLSHRLSGKQRFQYHNAE